MHNNRHNERISIGVIIGIIISIIIGLQGVALLLPLMPRLVVPPLRKGGGPACILGPRIGHASVHAVESWQIMYMSV